MNSSRYWFLVAALLLGSGVQTALAEPYLAVRMGLKCIACHVNPTGGGLRNDYGIIFATTVLPAQAPAGDAPGWTGKVSDWLRIGGDLRATGTYTSVPHQPSEHEFELNPVRLYANLNLIPDRLGVYVDERLSPGAAQSMEAYVRYGNTASGWYLKGGKFYLPFGWRLQDSTSFVRRATEISMSGPDTGLEVGFESPQWSAQLDLTNGLRNEGTGSGHQATGQLAWVQPWGRLGGAASFVNSDSGDRRSLGVFAGLHTGPLVWLAETDFVRDESFPDGTHSQIAALGEVNWELRRGHNLKLTGELWDANRDVSGDSQKRWSVVYELTPWPFMQLRAGVRRYDGIPENDLQNRSFTFLELHGFF